MEMDIQTPLAAPVLQDCVFCWAHMTACPMPLSTLSSLFSLSLSLYLSLSLSLSLSLYIYICVDIAAKLDPSCMRINQNNLQSARVKKLLRRRYQKRRSTGLLRKRKDEGVRASRTEFHGATRIALCSCSTRWQISRSLYGMHTCHT